ncbi:protein kinase [Pyxidicoccus fallax]|uniref:Protein kinase n=1 Tax=Pyxidicoccus fallax TaxID=394095 RepID=A0A848LZL4_9BACT|nr:protein kinase [Pyxidicoccus fallax]NMO22972.1 protein kinase [Pyxidicoccus fallax]NPC85454.1 protein kinase [Pyxidicoccus fallax]
MGSKSSQGGEPSWPSMGDGGSDYGDSLLQAVLDTQPEVRLPVPGEWLGGKDGRRFQIRAHLGRGGTGEVFQAWDEELQRVVALKFLPPHAGLTELALDEARAIARLDHENIVRLFDVSEWVSGPGEPSIPFLVMECLEGESLARILERGRPGLRRALEIFDDILAGLAHAHERSIIHRDLKPNNVYIVPKGTAKLLDFGLAHLVVRETSSFPRLPTAGTPPYMAPEQWRGAAQDERTDLWAAGVVLYEMLTGTLPYPGAHTQELAARVTSDEPVPSVRELRPELPRAVESLLATALAKDPVRRFQTAQELRDELRGLRTRLGPTDEPAAVQPPRAAPLPRQVTLVSCRLRGLGTLDPPLDPEDVGEVLLAFRQGSAELVRQYGGAMPADVGSEMLACFGCHQVREGDAERAVLAGLSLVRELPQRLRRTFPYLPASLAVSVGIQTDKVTLREGPPDAQEGSFNLHGEAPGLTAWLARQAGPGEVVIGETTRRMVHGGFETEALGTRDFDGLVGRVPLALHRVLRETEALTRFERMHAVSGLTSLVGRERELARLLELWEQARDGRGASILIRGEAGLGKSRLIQELLARVPPGAATRRHVQCWPRFNARGHSLVIELLRGAVPIHAGGSPQEQRRELEAELTGRGLSVEQAQLLGVLAGLPLPEGSPLRLVSPERSKERALEALRTLVLNMTAARPVLLTVEDLHWATSLHLEFLGSLLGHLEEARLLIVLSARPEFRSPWPHYPWVHALKLERLPAEQSSDLVKNVARGRGMEAELLQQLVRTTDGIPLFIEEMTRLVLERAPVRDLSPDALPHSIPATLHELLQARLDTLPSRQKSLAQLCSVVGRGFTKPLLSALVDQDRVTLQRDLPGLVDAGLLQPHREMGLDGYEFRHALIQEAAYQSLSRGRRRDYHLRIARALPEHAPETVRARPEVLAHHYTEAGLIEPAIRYWAQAGRQASLQSANQEAVGYLSRALKLLRGLPDAHQRLREELEILVALGLPLIQLQGYRSPEVERNFARVHDLFYPLGEVLPQLELAYWGIFSFYFVRAEYARARELSDWLLTLGHRQGNVDLLAQGYRMMATVSYSQGRPRESLEDFERAIACSQFDLEKHRELTMRHWNNPLSSAQAHASIVYSLVGQPRLARQRAREALELAEQIGHPHSTAYALTYLAVGAQMRREADSALEWASRANAISTEHGYWLWKSWSNLIRIWARAQLEPSQALLEDLERSLDEWQERGVRAGMPPHSAILAELHLKLGQVEPGLEAARWGLQWAEKTGERNLEPELHRLMGELLRMAGRPDEAKASFFRALAVARWQGSGLFELRAAVGLTRLLLDLGVSIPARRLLTKRLARLDPYGDSPDFVEARALLEHEAALERSP